MIAVLFASKGTHYRAVPGVDVYDEARDARTFTGSVPVVAHPPCRAWGRLRHFAKPAAHEKDLALFAVGKVRDNGGVLEHPEFSSLWPIAGLPQVGRDRFGGWTLPIDQRWFGHRARKRTWLYVVGVEPADIPGFPLDLSPPETTVERMGRAERERTPPALASWLVKLAAGVQ